MNSYLTITLSKFNQFLLALHCVKLEKFLTVTAPKCVGLRAPFYVLIPKCDCFRRVYDEISFLAIIAVETDNLYVALHKMLRY